MAFLAPLIPLAAELLPELAMGAEGAATATASAGSGIEGLLSSAGGLEGLAGEMTPALSLPTKNPMVEQEVFSGNMNMAQAGKMGSTLKDQGLFGLGGSIQNEGPQSLAPTSNTSLSGQQIQAIKNHGNPQVSIRGIGEDNKTFARQQLGNAQIPSGGNPVQQGQGKPGMWDNVKHFGMQVGSQAAGGLAMAAPMFLMPGMSGGGAANQAMPVTYSDLGGTVDQVGGGFYDNYQQGRNNIPMIQDYDNTSNTAGMYARDLITGNANLSDVDRHGAWSLLN